MLDSEVIPEGTLQKDLPIWINQQAKAQGEMGVQG